MPPPLRGQRSRTRLGRSFHLSANEWLEPAKQQEGGSSSTVRRVGRAQERVRRPLSRPPGHTVPAAQECGARPPESRPGASFSWRSNGGQSPRRAAASRRPLLSREPRGSVAVLAGAGGGTEGEGLLPSVVFKFRGRGWNALQASLPRPGARGGGALLLGRPPSAHLAKTNTFGGKDHTRQQEEQGGGRCRHRKPYGVSLGTPARQVTGRTTQQRAGIMCRV